METTVLSVGKSVLSGALSYAKSALAEEVALQLGVRRDQIFITNELEMMQAFLESAHDERDDNRVVKVWVKQVRDVAYDVEDTLHEFAVRLEKQSWWRIHRTLQDRRRVAKQMKELRANVEDVSQRNMRYNLIKGPGSKAAMAAEQSSLTSAALFDIDEARHASKQGKSKLDLVQLINQKEDDLRVIAVWGTSVDLGQMSIIRAVYESPDTKSKFSCRAWVRLMHPFNPKDFVQSMVEQFHMGVGAKALLQTEKNAQELAEKFDEYVRGRRYLIVINDLNTIEVWDRVKSCFPNNNMGSRIIVSTAQVEVASLCAGQESILSELKQSSGDENIYAFHEKVSQDGTNLTKTKSSSNCTSTVNNSTVPTGEISEDRSKGPDENNTVKRSSTRLRTMVNALEESNIIGREKEKDQIIKLILDQSTQEFQVITVWGMGGLGKTTLVKDIYQNQELSSMFEKRACVTVMRPFNIEGLFRSLIMQLNRESSEKKDVVGLLGSTKNTLLSMPLAELMKELATHIERKRCLIVVDDVSSTAEWNMIIPIFHGLEYTSRIIVTTREKNIAELCSKKKENIYMLKDLEYKDAHDLFTKKVFKETTDLDTQYPELVEQTDLILRKCGRLPLAIVTIGGFLASQPKTSLEWRKLNDHISAELEMNRELGNIIGREKEKDQIIKLILDQSTQEFQVITVWGMGGLGKTTLVKDIYQNQELSSMFEKRACVTVMRPFNIEGLLRSLIMQLDRESSDKKDVVGLMGKTRNTLLLMPLIALIKEMERLIEGKRCLIVLDDVSSTAEWNMIVQNFHGMEHTSRIVVTTREENIAKLCSQRQENIHMLKDLGHKDARDLFTRKVFKQTIDWNLQYPELVEQTEQILRRCGRLPLAIVTIGGFLSNRPKTYLEWRKLNENINSELEMNPELGTIRNVLMRSYDGLPYHLKSCFLYMPIFPEYYKVGRGRLARRWSAEGYSREVRGKSAEEIADSYFMELISRSMILPSQQSIHSTKGIDSCQVQDLIREIGVSKSMEENLVFTLEEGCSSNSQAMVRHLAISSNWKGDKSEFESMVDMSRLRSITCFGKWKSFFVSNKMRFLRVLDLEDTTGVYDHHLKHIGMLLHLRYLSLRGCCGVLHLPDSLGNLRQLETLDIRDTQILILPKTIIKLRKLNNLHAGKKSVDEVVSVDDEYVHEFPRAIQNRPSLFCLITVLSCIACCAPQLMLDGDNPSHRDACRFLCCIVLPSIAMRLDLYGVLLPKGMSKLKALRRLGVVNIGRRGKDVLQNIKRLIQLRKLGVTGVNKENGQKLCLAIVGLTRLESLSIRSEGEPGLCGCLEGKFSFPETLQSLKMYGNLVELPEWVQGLRNLVKLKLRSTMLSEGNGAMQVLGKLPNLVSLHLLKKSVSPSGFLFCEEAFPSLLLLELGTYVSVKFEQGALPKLELLKLFHMDVNSESLLGLPSLSSLKEVVVEGEYFGSEMAYLRAELARNPSRPVVKRI